MSSLQEDGTFIAGGSKSLAALNLGDNRELGSGGAVSALLMKLAGARQGGMAGIEQEKGGAGAVVLQELHLRRCCQGYGDLEEEGEGGGGGGDGGDGTESGMIAAATLALKPTTVYT